jgi:hypothetical protein
MYGTGRRSFLSAAKGYSANVDLAEIRRRALIHVANTDLADIERRALVHVMNWELPIVEATAQALAADSADPRNHFGKYVLRRYLK